MKTYAIAGAVLMLIVSAGLVRGEDLPQPPPPQKEHEWLNQFVGEWESEAEMYFPGQPTMKAKGTESARMLGGFWVVANGESEMMGQKFSSVLTVGYDPTKKKYVGTWVDSMGSNLWVYEGAVDETGKTLTLETEGPCPLHPSGKSKFKEVTEFKSPDHRVFTSNVLLEDGKWHTMVKVDTRRKK